jgi:ribonuclease HI
MSKNKNKFYAVVRGLKPGIYENWSGKDGAEAQVNGFPGARFQGFLTREEAKAWLQGQGESSENVVRDSSAKSEDKKGIVTLYTDGGCINNPGPGGYGVVLLYEEKRKELSGGFRHTTNNRMELTACIEGLKALKFPCQVRLYSDSQYVVNGIKKGWAKRWRQNGWMRNRLDPAENADLWEQLLDLCERHQVEFNWVKGHDGNPGNERCDQLATQAATGKTNLLPDTAFETGKTTVSSPQTLF